MLLIKKASYSRKNDFNLQESLYRTEEDDDWDPNYYYGENFREPKKLDIKLSWRGKGINEKAYDKNNKCIIECNKKYFRPTEVDLLIGDPSKAKHKLGWIPEYSLEDLVNDMMASDLELMKKEYHIKEGGYQILNYFE